MINEGHDIPSLTDEEFLQNYKHCQIFFFDIALRDALGPIRVMMFWFEELLTEIFIYDYSFEVSFSNHRETRGLCYSGLCNF